MAASDGDYPELWWGAGWGARGFHCLGSVMKTLLKLPNKLRSPCARDRVGTATGAREGAELLFGALELCVGEVATEAN